VGLIRLEFTINNHIRFHPLAVLHPEYLSKKEVKDIARIIKGYNNGREFFIDHLAQGIGTIAAAFYPRRVIVRFSDFKSNEYANLLGGSYFEPREANPMLGWRGASRYYSDQYRDAFALECAAVRRVRDTFGLKNLHVMIPFVRTLDEARKVLAEMERNRVKQHEDGLQVYGMCEVPSNVVLADEFLDIFDGYSIGSNDLTQLTLGVDRDSEIVSFIADERDECMKSFVKQVIRVAKRKNKYIGICGEAPSNYPDYASFLVAEGIDSISINPDSIVKTLKSIYETEHQHRSSGVVGGPLNGASPVTK